MTLWCCPVPVEHKGNDQAEHEEGQPCCDRQSEDYRRTPEDRKQSDVLPRQEPVVASECRDNEIRQYLQYNEDTLNIAPAFLPTISAVRSFKHD